jgi:hypothetical protein
MLDKYDGCTKIDWQFAEYSSNSIGAAPRGDDEHDWT